MVRHKLRRTLQAGRRPRPVQNVNAELLARRTPTAALGIGRTIDRALSLLNVALEPQTLLIPDQRVSGAPSPHTILAVTSRLARAGTVTIGLPDSFSANEALNWEALAAEAGVDTHVLGPGGWTRVNFGDRSIVLHDADLPVELYGESSLLALSAPKTAGCLGLWSEIAHPNTSLRARVSGNAIVELAMAVDARYLIVGQVGPLWLAVITAPAITAELVARAIQHLPEPFSGTESIGPWEDAGVQHLSALGEASQETTNLVLDVRLEDTSDDGIAHRLTEMLGWQFRISDDNARGSGSNE